MSHEHTEQQLIVKQNGEPFKTDTGARKVREDRGLSEEEWKVAPYGNGFALVQAGSEFDVSGGPASKDVAEKQKHEKMAERLNVDDRGPKKGEQYRKVRFHNRQNDSESEQVELGVNGEWLIVKRNVPVTIPERFIECARHARHPVYHQVPGEPRQQRGEVQTFPFDDLGVGQKEDFDKMRQEGTLATKQAYNLAD